MGVVPGTPLTFRLDPLVRVEVVDDHHVKLLSAASDSYRGIMADGQPRTLTEILRNLQPIHGSLSNPCKWWLLDDGRPLRDLYDATWPPG